MKPSESLSDSEQEFVSFLDGLTDTNLILKSN